jgi:hypothetical protein
LVKLKIKCIFYKSGFFFLIKLPEKKNKNASAGFT